MTEKNAIIWQQSLVSDAQRQTLFEHKALTVWFTGLSGAGKSTIAFALERRLISMGLICCVLDGDNVRHGLNSDLGFSDYDRTENIRRVAEVSHLMNSAGLIVITSFISPFRDDRAKACSVIGKDKFIEVYISADLDVCEGRDPKGLYRRARSGELSCFTGISSPYEPPSDAELTLDTIVHTVDTCVESLVSVVIKRCGLDGMSYETLLR